jgi:glycyl-tRNA synthetase beta chain
MVGEFPELQGVMGGYYARAEGLPDAVADAIRNHYKPVGQGDDVPTAPVTVAVSLADKLDTLVGFFGVGLPPSGSKDPFALRRSAIGVLQLLTTNLIRIDLRNFYVRALQDHVSRFVGSAMKQTADADTASLIRSGTSPYLVTSPEYQKQFLARPDVKAFIDGFATADIPFLDFFADRLKVQQREAGVRHDLIDAVFALDGEDDLVRLLARVKALQAFVETEDGANLVAGYKRAANILRAEEKKDGTPPPAFDGFPYDPDPAEAALAETLARQIPLAEAAIAHEQFESAMQALSVMRPAIDRFFDDVTVNSPDETRRATRLSLLVTLYAAMHKIADFSKLEG